MSLILEIETFLIFPILFVERFIAPSASEASTALHKRRSFGLRHNLHNCLSVFVKGVQGLLAVLWVPVVLGGELIL